MTTRGFCACCGMPECIIDGTDGRECFHCGDGAPMPVDHGSRIKERIEEAVRALRDSGGWHAQIADDLPVVRGVADALSGAGWVTRIERMDDGQTGLLRIAAPASEGGR